MPLFTYQALDSKGKKFQGSIDASSQEEAKQKLRAQGILVVSLSIGNLKNKKGVSKSDLVTFTLQLAQLISSGIPIYDSLVLLEEQSRKEKIHPILLTLCEEIKGGQSLSKSLESFPEIFDLRYRSMIAAGEAAGALENVLKKLAEALQKEQKLKGQMISALIYPMILSGFSLFVIATLLLFVIPTMEELFEGKNLGFLTQTVLSFSHFFRSFGLYLLLFLGLFAAFIFYQLKKPTAKEKVDQMMLRLPFIKEIITKASLGRFCRTLATLQEGGLTLTEGIAIAKGVLGNTVFEQEIEKACQKVEEGESFSIQLQQSLLIPPFFAKMVAVGEDTGQGGQMFLKIADIYEEEVEKSLNRLVGLAQPVILIVMGLFIGLIMMAILLPLTDVGALNV